MKSPSQPHLFSIPVFSNHDASLQFCSMLLLSKQSMRKGRQHVIVLYVPLVRIHSMNSLLKYVWFNYYFKGHYTRFEVVGGGVKRN